MICAACNYNSNNKEDFHKINIEGKFVLNRENKIFDIETRDNFQYQMKKISLWICPNCETVRAE